MRAFLSASPETVMEGEFHWPTGSQAKAVLYWNPESGDRQAVPRPAEIVHITARKICRCLNIPMLGIHGKISRRFRQTRCAAFHVFNEVRTDSAVWTVKVDEIVDGICRRMNETQFAALK